MRHFVRILSLLVLGSGALSADVLVLKDGRKVSGRVTEKKDGYEIQVEGETLAFGKDDVTRHIKSPREIVGDADKLLAEAKAIYLQAVEIKDDKLADAKFREALPKVTKAREAYAEARDLFPEGNPELDTQLVQIMKLMRLVRERIGSQLAGSPTAPSVVKTKESPPPTIAPKTPEPVVKAPEPVVEPPAAFVLADALAIMADPAKRADDVQRGQARVLFRKAAESGGPVSDVAMAGYLFLSRPDEDWGLQADVVTVKGPGGDATYKGRLLVRGDGVSSLVLADKREVRLRVAGGTTHVTPPGGAEFKAAECKIAADQQSPCMGALQDFFKGSEIAKFETQGDREVAEGVKFLSLKVKELRTKAPSDPALDALALFVSGPASALIAKNGGKPTPELEASFKDLGFEKSEYGAMWGRKDGLAMDDYRKWSVSGEYGLAVVQFQSDYSGLPEFHVRYAMSLLMVMKAVADNRNYTRAASFLEKHAQSVSTAVAKDHLTALAKSIRLESPCPACGGTHKVNCTACKGKKKVDLICNKCGGSGSINTFNGVVKCPGFCAGKGRLNDQDCTKCKQTGQTDCKVRGCRMVGKPSFESFADAWKCALCRGMGSVMRHVAQPCPECTGIGLILQPKADPSKLLR